MSYFQPNFIAHGASVRVRFGAGLRHCIAEEIKRLDAQRALVLSTPAQADLANETAQDIGTAAAGVFSKAAMHTPVDVTGEAVACAKRLEADCLVAVGGGSTVGLGKAVALRTGLPQIAVPTTYAGSEATPILGQTEDGAKTTLTDPAVRPDVIVYDPELLATLPVPATVTSALNAIAHAVEALYARDRNPVSTALAVDGMRAFANALPKVAADPEDIAARGETLYGAWLCGTVLGQVGMALHHKLCHALGGSLGLPHAETHAVVLPYAVAHNEAAVARELEPVSEVFGGGSPATSLRQFAEAAGAPIALRDIGARRADLTRAAENACANPYWNPAPLDRGSIERLLDAAWEGRAPGS